MARKRVSSDPPLERAKLGSVHEINTEIRKLYRRFANGQISEAALKARVATLAALRAGMADPVEPVDDGPGIETVNIISIPTQLERGRRLRLHGSHADRACAPLARAFAPGLYRAPA